MRKTILTWLNRKVGKPEKRRSIGVVSASVATEKTVNLGGHNVTVRSLSFGDWLEVMPQLNAIPAVIANYFSNKQDIGLTEFLFAATEVVQDELVEVIAQITNLDHESVKKARPAEMIRFVKAFYEVNEFEYVAGEIRAAVRMLTARMNQKPSSEA